MMHRFDGKLLKDPATAPLPYVRGKTKAWIVGGVSAFHAGLIIIPLLLMTLWRFFDPPLLVMNIPIVDSLPNENLVMSPHPAPGRPYSTGTPDYGEPKPLTDIPDVPALPPKGEPKEPEGGPAPEETKPVKEKTEPEKMPVTKKPETAEKETVPDITEKSVTGTKPKKSPRYKSANEIKISTKHVKLPAQSQGSGTKSGRGSGTAVSSGQQGTPDGDPNRREIGNLIRSLTGTPGGRGIPGGGGGPKGVLSKDISDYYNAVEVFLKRRWDQPNIEMLNRTSPKVIVRFKVDSDGRLLSAIIISKSGINAMDASVQALLSSLKVLPPPPMAMEFLVTLEIDR